MSRYHVQVDGEKYEVIYGDSWTVTIQSHLVVFKEGENKAVFRDWAYLKEL